MPQLTADMYRYADPEKEGLFGLCYGQIRFIDERITFNSGWYNRSGEKIGFGDLSAKDFKRISEEIEENECFVVLSEKDSLINLGVEYVAQHAEYVVTSKNIFKVDPYWQEKNTTVEISGVIFKILRRFQIAFLGSDLVILG